MRLFVRLAIPAIAGVWFLAPLAHAYNSEEHKLLVDMAVPRLRIDPSVILPTPTHFGPASRDSLLKIHHDAKYLAVGFTTNNPADYDSFRFDVQDNCYWTGFGQLAGNRKIWIPARSQLCDTMLMVASVVSGTQDRYTIGELAAIYGDYRRTTRCVDGNCYLTHASTPTLRFERGNVANSGYCPTPRPMYWYLKYIANGVWPPYGAAGNATGNTAKTESDFFEAGWWGDEMLRIANTNDWHFSSGAVAWYVGMHRLALHYVDSARVDIKYWNDALHCEANALHSLTDLFAFGHVVTNRDRTSHEIMKDRTLLGDKDYKWMEHVLELGGGARDPDSGYIRLGTTFPAISEVPGDRDDFLPSYVSPPPEGWAGYALYEKYFHDAFNGGGGWVRNLLYDRFFINGDGAFWKMTDATKAVIVEAVRTSLQSLFDAYLELERGRTVAEVGAVGSPFLAALKSLPVFVESNPTYDYEYQALNGLWYTGTVGGNFNGRWTLYAKALDVLAGTNIVPNGTTNTMGYVDGELYFETLPTSNAGDTFPDKPPPGPAPVDFALEQNAPNPFDPTTTISFRLPHSAHARLEILDIHGKRVVTLVDETRPAGPNSAQWDSVDESGRRVASGIYFCRLTVDGKSLARKLSNVR